jgi:hypothetical protein
LDACEAWLDDVFTRFISFATVNMNVFGFEFAISINEFRAKRHVSANGASGKLMQSLLSEIINYYWIRKENSIGSYWKLNELKQVMVIEH